MVDSSCVLVVVDPYREKERMRANFRLVYFVVNEWKMKDGSLYTCWKSLWSKSGLGLGLGPRGAKGVK